MSAPSFDALHRLGRFHEIRGCPGRYVLPNGELSSSDVPTMLRALLPSASDVPLVRRLARLGPRGDAVDLCVFDDLGGILTFCKHAADDDAAADAVFVHTLNSPSGLERKLRALGVVLVLDQHGKLASVDETPTQ